MTLLLALPILVGAVIIVTGIADAVERAEKALSSLSRIAIALEAIAAIEKAREDRRVF